MSTIICQLSLKTEAPVHQRDGDGAEHGHKPPEGRHDKAKDNGNAKDYHDRKRTPVVVANVFFVGEPGRELAGGVADVFPHDHKTKADKHMVGSVDDKGNIYIASKGFKGKGGGEGQENDEHQQEEVQPDQAAVVVDYIPEQAVVHHPVNADEQKAGYKTHELERNTAEGFPDFKPATGMVHFFGHFYFYDEQGDGYCENSVGKEDQPVELEFLPGSENVVGFMCAHGIRFASQYRQLVIISFICTK